MKKIILSLFIIVGFCLGTAAQQPRKGAVNEELKKELMNTLSMQEETAGKAVVIEDEFYTALTIASAMPIATKTEREARDKKIHELHVVRREKLMAIPLTGRQMEDVITASDRLHRSQKNA